MASKLDVVELGGAMERVMQNAGAQGSGLLEIYENYKTIRPEIVSGPRHRDLERRMARFRNQRNKCVHGEIDRKTGKKVNYEPSELVLKGVVQDGLYVLNYLEAVEASREEGVAVTEAEVREALAPRAKQAAAADEDIRVAYAQAKAFVEWEMVEHRVLAAPTVEQQSTTQAGDSESSTPESRVNEPRGPAPDPQTVKLKKRIAVDHPDVDEGAEKFRREFEEMLAKARRKAFFMQIARNLWAVSKWLALKAIQLALR